MPRGVYIKTKEHRIKLSLASQGKRMSKEARVKMSLAKKGIKLSEATKRKIRIGNKGKYVSQKTRKKLSKIRKKRLQTYKEIGQKAHNWKGGRRKTAQGYIYIYKPIHPFANKQNCVFEHRLVMEKKLGRYLKPEERVHHINGIKSDNRPSNLELFSNESQHQTSRHKLHPKTNLLR